MKVKVPWKLKMVRGTVVHGKTVSNMGKDSTPGPMETSIKENTNMARGTALA